MKKMKAHNAHHQTYKFYLYLVTISAPKRLSLTGILQ